MHPVQVCDRRKETEARDAVARRVAADSLRRGLKERRAAIRGERRVAVLAEPFRLARVDGDLREECETDEHPPRTPHPRDRAERMEEESAVERGKQVVGSAKVELPPAKPPGQIEHPAIAVKEVRDRDDEDRNGEIP